MRGLHGGLPASSAWAGMHAGSVQNWLCSPGVLGRSAPGACGAFAVSQAPPRGLACRLFPFSSWQPREAAGIGIPHHTEEEAEVQGGLVTRLRSPSCKVLKSGSGPGQLSEPRLSPSVTGPSETRDGTHPGTPWLPQPGLPASPGSGSSYRCWSTVGTWQMGSLRLSPGGLTRTSPKPWMGVQPCLTALRSDVS